MSVRKMCLAAGSILVLLLAAGSQAPLYAANPGLPAGFVREVVASVDKPTAMAFDGSTIYVATWTGAVRVILPDGRLRPQPYVTLHVTNLRESGLDGIALHPDYAHQPYVYVYYTTAPGALNYSGKPANRVSRFLTANGVGTNEEILLDNLPVGTEGMHNGGGIVFGPDRRLYVPVGDSGNTESAQKLNWLTGKILRINANGKFPRVNPFYKPGKQRSAIYAYGLRNPYRIVFHPTTHTLYAGDVGWNTWEELDVIKAGKNYGWAQFEGPCPYGLYCDPAQTNFQGTVPPIWYYAHQDQASPYSAITAGTFPVGTNFPAPFEGGLFVGDYSGWIKVLTLDARNHVTAVTDFDTLKIPVDFKMGADHLLYVADHGANTIYRYRYVP